MFRHNLKSIAITAIICYAVFYLSWFHQNKDPINFYTIFLTLTFFFYFGQFSLFLVGVPLGSGISIVDDLLPFDKIIETGVFLLNYMMILHMGVMLSTINISRFKKSSRSLPSFPTYKETLIDKRLKLVAVMLFIVSIVPSVIILIRNIRITLSSSYAAIFQSQHYTLGGFDNLLRFISLLTIPSLIMMLVAYKENIKAIRMVSIIIIIYLTLYFLSGTRINGVFLILTILLIRHHWYRRIDFKMVIILGVVGISGSIFIRLISEVRNILAFSNNPGALLIKTIPNVISRNPIFSLMAETGYTFLTTATVLTYSPSVIPHYHGVSYLNSFLMLFPNLFWDVHPAAKINTDIVFKGFLTSYGGIGSSFIAESYWNFGYYSLLVALFFGLLIGGLTIRITKYSVRKNTINFFLSVYLAYLSFFFVRVDAGGFLRNFFYYGLSPVFLAILLSKIRK